MSFRPLFGQFTILSLSFVTFRVSRFHVSHLTYETFKLGLQNTLNMSKMTRVYFRVLQVQGAFKKMAHVEAGFQESRVVAWMLLDITCIRMLDFNMYLYKSVINS